MLNLLTKKGELHHLCSENKSVEQLGGNHTTDLCLCCYFVVAKTVFSLSMLLIINCITDVRRALHVLCNNVCRLR